MVKRWILIFITAWLTFSCDENEVEKQGISWQSFGLENHIINQLDVYGNKIFASTDKGLYQQSISSQSPDWQQIGFEGENISSFVILNNEFWLASKVIDSDPQNSAIYKSKNQGITWEKLDQQFGEDIVEPLNDFAYDKANDLLYGTGTQLIAVSENKGQSWEPVYGDWGGFGSGVDVVELNPDNSNEIWAGGQGGIENGFLLKSDNGGESWTEWQDLVENPTVVKTIVFDPDNSSTILVGWEGALQRTENSGETWNTIIDSEENKFFFGAAFSKNFPDRIYTAGWLKEFDNPQPLKVFISGDNGETWRTVSSEIEQFGGVIEMLQLPSSDSDEFLLGLYKGGVVKVKIRE